MSTPEPTHPDEPDMRARRPRLHVVHEDATDASTLPPDPQAWHGPLLAVCGLRGGAGASTLAYVVALSAARTFAGPVLVCDTGPATSGLAACAGVSAPRSLVEIAEQLAAGLPPGPLHVSAQDGVRVLASGPRFEPSCPAPAVQRLLQDARAAHALTVVDCGTLARQAEQIALAAASHVAWVLPATPSGVRCAERVLQAINPCLPGRELILARGDKSEGKTALRELKRIAAHRHAPLMLIPHLPDPRDGAANAALEIAQVPLQAILGELGR
jgi:Flp pilus assembly CpaE family ATPase